MPSIRESDQLLLIHQSVYPKFDPPVRTHPASLLIPHQELPTPIHRLQIAPNPPPASNNLQRPNTIHKHQTGQKSLQLHLNQQSIGQFYPVAHQTSQGQWGVTGEDLAADCRQGAEWETI